MIQHWDKVLRRLKYPTRTKILKLIENNCIHKANGYDKFMISPIKGYNRTTYCVQKIGDTWYCNCQGYSAKVNNGEHPYCSHIFAVKIYLKQREREKNIQQKLFV